MTSIEVTAPAKVNLFLDVLYKRKDSYHNILTIFERVSLADKIRITKLPDSKDIIVRSDKFITRRPEDNLIYKAARLILKRYKISCGVRIELKKNIPVAAGLGGGSSDAASVLIGINRLFRLNIKKKALMSLGGRIGADVPFFIFEAPFALGKSRGEDLEKIPAKARFWHLLVYPGFGVSTGDIYKAFDAPKGLTPRQSSASTSSAFALSLPKGSGSSPEHLPKGLTRKPAGAKITLPLGNALDFGTAESMLHNGLEDIVKSKYSMIGGILERLAHILDKKIILSGSGPSLFCLYRTRKEVVKAKRRLFGNVPRRERKLWQVFIARTT